LEAQALKYENHSHRIQRQRVGGRGRWRRGRTGVRTVDRQSLDVFHLHTQYLFAEKDNHIKGLPLGAGGDSFPQAKRLDTVQAFVGSANKGGHIAWCIMKDLLLSIVIKTAESMEQSPRDLRGQSVTLNVGGILITGILISQKLYMQLFMDGIIQEVLDKAKAAGNLPDPDGLNENSAEFIHLASARFWLPGHRLDPVNGVLWRGRIDSVDGFILGEPKGSNDGVA
jgi:hypothetical protein